MDWFQTLLNQYGYGVLFGVVFLNNLFLPLPGDSVLFGAGFLVGKGTFSFWEAVVTGATAAFLGCNGGYLLGLHYGRRLLHRFGWFQANPKRVRQVDLFFKKHGARSVFFARFVALLHPITGLFAGMGKTPWKPFLLYNMAGSFGYALLYTLAGHFLGRRWEPIKAWLGLNFIYALLILAVLVILGVLFRRRLHDLWAGSAKKQVERSGRKVRKGDRKEGRV